MADYSKLVGSGLAFAGVDQGIDFTGAGDVYSPYAAVVTRVRPGGSGWPGQGAVINLTFLEGPAKGSHVYYAEDLAPVAGLKAGSRVPAGAKIAYATGSGLAPGIEIGWAQASGIPLAPRPPARPADQRTAAGASFDAFVQGIVGPHLPSSSWNPLHVGGDSIAGSVAGGVKTAVDDTLALPRFLGKITDPHNILRGLQVVAGAGLVLTGVVLLARQVALAPDLPAGPVGKAASAAAGGTG